MRRIVNRSSKAGRVFAPLYSDRVVDFAVEDLVGCSKSTHAV